MPTAGPCCAVPKPVCFVEHLLCGRKRVRRPARSLVPSELGFLLWFLREASAAAAWLCIEHSVRHQTTCNAPLLQRHGRDGRYRVHTQQRDGHLQRHQRHDRRQRRPLMCVVSGFADDVVGVQPPSWRKHSCQCHVVLPLRMHAASGRGGSGCMLHCMCLQSAAPPGHNLGFRMMLFLVLLLQPGSPPPPRRRARRGASSARRAR